MTQDSPTLPSTSQHKGLPVVQTSPAWQLTGLPQSTWERGREWVVVEEGRKEGCQENHSCPSVPDLGVAALYKKPSETATISYLTWGLKPGRGETARVLPGKGQLPVFGSLTEFVAFSTFLFLSPASPDLFFSSFSLPLTLPQSFLLGCSLQPAASSLLWPNAGTQRIPFVPQTSSSTFW